MLHSHPPGLPIPLLPQHTLHTPSTVSPPSPLTQTTTTTILPPPPPRRSTLGPNFTTASRTRPPQGLVKSIPATIRLQSVGEEVLKDVMGMYTVGGKGFECPREGGTVGLGLGLGIGVGGGKGGQGKKEVDLFEPTPTTTTNAVKKKKKNKNKKKPKKPTPLLSSLSPTTTGTVDGKGGADVVELNSDGDTEAEEAYERRASVSGNRFDRLLEVERGEVGVGVGGKKTVNVQFEVEIEQKQGLGSESEPADTTDEVEISSTHSEAGTITVTVEQRDVAVGEETNSIAATEASVAEIAPPSPSPFKPTSSHRPSPHPTKAKILSTSTSSAASDDLGRDKENLNSRTEGPDVGGGEWKTPPRPSQQYGSGRGRYNRPLGSYNRDGQGRFGEHNSNANTNRSASTGFGYRGDTNSGVKSENSFRSSSNRNSNTNGDDSSVYRRPSYSRSFGGPGAGGDGGGHGRGRGSSTGSAEPPYTPTGRGRKQAPPFEGREAVNSAGETIWINDATEKPDYKSQVFVTRIPRLARETHDIRIDIRNHFRAMLPERDTVDITRIMDDEHAVGEINAYVRFKDHKTAQMIISEPQYARYQPANLPETAKAAEEDVFVLRLEEADPWRTLWLKIAGPRRDEPVVNSNPDKGWRPAKYERRLPLSVTFEKALIPNGRDHSRGMNKYWSKTQLNIYGSGLSEEDVRKEEFKREGHSGVQARIDVTAAVTTIKLHGPEDQKQLFTQMCGLFGELEEVNDGPDVIEGGIEIKFADANAAIKACNNLRLIDGFSVFWKDEKHRHVQRQLNQERNVRSQAPALSTIRSETSHGPPTTTKLARRNHPSDREEFPALPGQQLARQDPLPTAAEVEQVLKESQIPAPSADLQATISPDVDQLAPEMGPEQLFEPTANRDDTRSAITVVLPEPAVKLHDQSPKVEPTVEPASANTATARPFIFGGPSALETTDASLSTLAKPKKLVLTLQKTAVVPTKDHGSLVTGIPHSDAQKPITPNLTANAPASSDITSTRVQAGSPSMRFPSPGPDFPGKERLMVVLSNLHPEMENVETVQKRLTGQYGRLTSTHFEPPRTPGGPAQCIVTFGSYNNAQQAIQKENGRILNGMKQQACFFRENPQIAVLSEHQYEKDRRVHTPVVDAPQIRKMDVIVEESLSITPIVAPEEKPKVESSIIPKPPRRLILSEIPKRARASSDPVGRPISQEAATPPAQPAVDSQQGHGAAVIDGGAVGSTPSAGVHPVAMPMLAFGAPPGLVVGHNIDPRLFLQQHPLAWQQAVNQMPPPPRYDQAGQMVPQPYAYPPPPWVMTPFPGSYQTVEPPTTPHTATTNTIDHSLPQIGTDNPHQQGIMKPSDSAVDTMSPVPKETQAPQSAVVSAIVNNTHRHEKTSSPPPIPLNRPGSNEQIEQRATDSGATEESGSQSVLETSQPPGLRYIGHYQSSDGVFHVQYDPVQLQEYCKTHQIQDHPIPKEPFRVETHPNNLPLLPLATGGHDSGVAGSVSSANSESQGAQRVPASVPYQPLLRTFQGGHEETAMHPAFPPGTVPMSQPYHPPPGPTGHEVSSGTHYIREGVHVPPPPQDQRGPAVPYTYPPENYPKPATYSPAPTIHGLPTRGPPSSTESLHSHYEAHGQMVAQRGGPPQPPQPMGHSPVGPGFAPSQFLTNSNAIPLPGHPSEAIYSTQSPFGNSPQPVHASMNFPGTMPGQAPPQMPVQVPQVPAHHIPGVSSGIGMAASQHMINPMHHPAMFMNPQQQQQMIQHQMHFMNGVAGGQFRQPLFGGPAQQQPGYVSGHMGNIQKAANSAKNRRASLHPGFTGPRQH